MEEKVFLELSINLLHKHSWNTYFVPGSKDINLSKQCFWKSRRNIPSHEVGIPNLLWPPPGHLSDNPQGTELLCGKWMRVSEKRLNQTRRVSNGHAGVALFKVPSQKFFELESQTEWNFGWVQVQIKRYFECWFNRYRNRFVPAQTGSLFLLKKC